MPNEPRRTESARASGRKTDWLRWVWLAALAVSTISFFSASILSAKKTQPGGLGEEISTPPSRFGKLTSRRWAYGLPYERTNLVPVKNPHPSPEPQPRRDHPIDVAVSADGTKVYVGLQGSELEPGSEVAVYDVAREKVVGRIPLRPDGEAGPAASSPFKLRMHPGGRFLWVNSRFSNFASVIDTRTDAVVSEVPLDFYCQDVAFTQDGRTCYVTDRYLDQVFVVDVDADGDTFQAGVRELGGLDDKEFFGGAPGHGEKSVHAILQEKCGGCHAESEGGFFAGEDPLRSFLSAVSHVQPGNASESRLLLAVVGTQFGGYANIEPKNLRHAGGTVVFRNPPEDPDYQALARWINKASEGPGIPVGNPRSKPRFCTLSTDERYLFVGNTGTQDIAIVDTRSLREVGAIFIQNFANDLKVYHHPSTGADYLIVSTAGIGFGVTRERDPYGGESWDGANPAAHFSLWRDIKTAKVLPKSEQTVLGPFHAVDGTSEIKFRDLQNDIVIVNLSKLAIPEDPPAGKLEHILLANRYEAHKKWVRYTSDTAESTYGDFKGDIPPDLMRVVGALPFNMALVGDRVFVTMQGSNQVQELQINPDASEPSDYLTPVGVYPAGMQPIGIAAGPKNTPADGKLFVANFLGGSLSVIDTATGDSKEVVVDPSVLKRPVPDTNAERGEIFAHTSIFSSDGDTSCFHCHYLDMGDSRPWGVSQVVGQEFISPDDPVGHLVNGGTMGVPQMRGLFEVQPFFYEGVISAFEPRSMIMEHNPADDFMRPVPGYDLTWIKAHYELTGTDDVQASMDSSTTFDANREERRDEMFRDLSMRYFGKAFAMRDLVRFVGEWQIAEPHLLPNPYDPTNASVLRGREVFFEPQVGCSACHPPPAFTRKNLQGQGDFTDKEGGLYSYRSREQAMPPVVTFTARDGAFTLIGMNRLDAINRYARDLEPWDTGRAEEEQGNVTISQLRGIWDRPPVFLHNGLARTLREVAATPGHLALRKLKYNPLLGGVPERPGRREVGFNETIWYKERSEMAKLHFASKARMGMDTHGGTSQLRAQQIDDLVNFLLTIE